MSLVLAIAVLFLGTSALSVLSEIMVGKKDEWNLHVGTGILVGIIGGMLFAFWGWWSTAAVFAILVPWTVFGALKDRLEHGSKTSRLDGGDDRVDR